ncbi:MAG: hypothetical protein ACQER7_07470 [Bacteroidota bacterium]
MKNNTHIRFICLVLLTLPLLLTHCTYDNEVEKYMDSQMSCDTSNVTYSGEVQPILENNCYACHKEENAASVGTNIILDNYDDVKNNANRMLKAVQHEPGYSPMPKGQPQLDECTIAKIRIWVEEDAPNN